MKLPAILIGSALNVLIFASTTAFANFQSADDLAPSDKLPPSDYPRGIKWYRSPDGKIVRFSAIAEYRKAIEDSIGKEGHGTWSDRNSELCFVVSLGTTGELLSVEIIDADPASVDRQELAKALAAINASKFPKIPESFNSAKMMVPISFYKLSKQNARSEQDEKPPEHLNQ